jgi:hypothetical protein
MPRVHHSYWIALLVLSVTLLAEEACAGVSLAISPESTVVTPGAEFTVDVVVAAVGDPFNGYDAIVGYDPARLELILPLPRSAGEGALFKDACPQRFLNVAVAGDSASVTVSHVLLCAGTTVSGPGPVYQLRFRARGILGQTHLMLLDGTAAYDSGDYVEPVETSDARVWIGDASSTPVIPDRPGIFAVPNPFNPRTEIRGELAESQVVRLEVFDAAGRRIDLIFEGWVPSGPFRFTWNGRDAHGRSLASGVYHALLTTGSGTHAVTRMVLVR